MADYVLVHGFTQSAASWAAVPGLQDATAIAVPDAETFVDAARLLGDQRATYVGYSLGGRLCLQHALDSPDAVERLALISASPGIADPTERAARRASDDQLARDVERDGVEAFVDRWLAQPMFATLPRDRSMFEDRVAVNTVERLTYQLRVLGQGAQPSNWERLGELRMPVLLVVGELDAKYVDIAHRMADAITGARLEVVPGAGHACHLEQPDAVGHLLASW